MQENKRNAREKLKVITDKSLFIVTVLIVSLLLSICAGQLGTLLLYIVVLITLWTNRWDWKYFGLTKPIWSITILRALLFTIVILLLNDILIQPLSELYFGKIELGETGGIEGNLFNYVSFIFLGWILGGFCEEIIYRGYVLRRFAIILGDTNKTWLLSAVTASIIFGFAHSYQGTSGIITTAMIALIFGFIFILNKNNLMVLVLTHGMYNSIAITLIYLGKARLITDYVHEFIK